MKPASIEVIPYALPFREPYVTARGTLGRREMVLLRVRDGDGAEGLGEAVPLSLRGGASLETVAGELHSWDPEAGPALLSPPPAARSRRQCSTSAPARPECRPGDRWARTAPSRSTATRP